MSSTTVKTEGGSGGRRGHSNMNHRERTEVIKSKSKRARRIQAKVESSGCWNSTDSYIVV